MMQFSEWQLQEGTNSWVKSMPKKCGVVVIVYPTTMMPTSYYVGFYWEAEVIKKAFPTFPYYFDSVDEAKKSVDQLINRFNNLSAFI